MQVADVGRREFARPPTSRFGPQSPPRSPSLCPSNRITSWLTWTLDRNLVSPFREAAQGSQPRPRTRPRHDPNLPCGRPEKGRGEDALRGLRRPRYARPVDKSARPRLRTPARLPPSDGNPEAFSPPPPLLGRCRHQGVHGDRPPTMARSMGASSSRVSRSSRSRDSPLPLRALNPRWRSRWSSTRDESQGAVTPQGDS
jgi:hypothetical protein